MVGSEANEPGSEHAAHSPRIVRRSRHHYPDGLLGQGERARERAAPPVVAPDLL